MSRIHAVSREGYRVAFGLDHALGWFYDEWCETSDENLPLHEESTMFTGLNKSRLVEMLHERLGLGEQVRLRREIMNVALDLDPGEIAGGNSYVS